jgi:hypothetical protein
MLGTMITPLAGSKSVPKPVGLALPAWVPGRVRWLAGPLIGASLAAAPLPAQDPDPGGFRPLFDGRSLDGWVNVNCAPGTWSAQDGMIHCTGVPTGELRTARQYENFVLELEWRHLVPGGNAGVFVWAAPISAPGQPFLRAIEVQVLDTARGNSDQFTSHGDIFPIHGSTMVPDEPSRGSRSFPSEFRSKGAPEWNQYHIECNDGTIKLSVNGKQVSGGRDCNYRKGYIALESEGGVVDYRNIRIRELPPTGADAGNSAPEAQGHRPLYSGMDLSGWTASGPDPDGWKASDWKLVFTPPAARPEPGSGGAPLLSTSEQFGDCEVICDWRWPEQAPPAAALASADGALASLPPAAAASAKPGEWHRAVLRHRNGALEVEVDGRPAGTAAPLPSGHRGPIVLRPGAVATEFAGIYVRALGGE